MNLSYPFLAITYFCVPESRAGFCEYSNIPFSFLVLIHSNFVFATPKVLEGVKSGAEQQETGGSLCPHLRSCNHFKLRAFRVSLWHTLAAEWRLLPCFSWVFFASRELPEILGHQFPLCFGPFGPAWLCPSCFQHSGCVTQYLWHQQKPPPNKIKKYHFST